MNNYLYTTRLERSDDLKTSFESYFWLTMTIAARILVIGRVGWITESLKRSLMISS